MHHTVSDIQDSHVETGDIDNLIERFEEDTNSTDLTGFVRYQSIGQIVQQLPDKSQQKIADMIQVNLADLSTDVSVYELGKELVGLVRASLMKLPDTSSSFV